MKLSELTREIVCEYIRADDCNEKELDAMLAAARDYIKSYTGMTDEECDRHEGITIAALCLCSDFYDQRQMSISQSTPNRTVETILNMHRRNLL